MTARYYIFKCRLSFSDMVFFTDTRAHFGQNLAKFWENEMAFFTEGRNQKTATGFWKYNTLPSFWHRIHFLTRLQKSLRALWKCRKTQKVAFPKRLRKGTQIDKNPNIFCFPEKGSHVRYSGKKNYVKWWRSQFCIVIWNLPSSSPIRQVGFSSN